MYFSEFCQVVEIRKQNRDEHQKKKRNLNINITYGSSLNNGGGLGRAIIDVCVFFNHDLEYNFIVKDRFIILGLLLACKWERSSGGTHVINSLLSLITQPSSVRRCQLLTELASFELSSKDQILIAPS